MTNNSKIGGILAIVSGAVGILYVFLFIFLICFFAFMITSTDPGAFNDPAGQAVFRFMAFLYGGMGVLFAIASVLAIIGGVYALKKKHWGLALAGAICGSFTFSPAGIAAIIFVILGKPEFAAVPAAPIVPQATSTPTFPSP